MKPFYLQKNNVYFVPILHGNFESALNARNAFLEIEPDCLLLELPESLQTHFPEALNSLPEIPVILLEREETTYFILEPCDSFVECGRLAKKNKIPIFTIDADIENYPMSSENFPDTHSISVIGTKTYFETILEQEFEKSDEDILRENVMAFNIQKASKNHEKILVLIGVTHLKSVKEKFEDCNVRPFFQKVKPTIGVFNLHPESTREILLEWAVLNSAFENYRSNVEFFTEKKIVEEDFGNLKFVKNLNSIRRKKTTEELIEEESWSIFEKFAKNQNREDLILACFETAAIIFEKETGEKVSRLSKKQFLQLVRNQAKISGKLMPRLFQILYAARGIVDENFCYDFWNLLTLYPYQNETGIFPTIKLDPETIWFGTKKMRVRRLWEGKGKKRPKFNVKKRKYEKNKGDWEREFEPDSMCSFPPEDIVIEDFGNFLKNRGLQLVSEEHSRTVPFQTSLADGIDIRETIRNWHENKIYVKENLQIKGSSSTVVLIFDEDKDENYTYCMTWLGEHSQESDMAFYSTNPQENIVGPGISRVEYGGLLLNSPPLRMFDIWNDPDYYWLESKAEILLLAAIEYSEEKFVIYVADKPPRSIFNSIASRYKRVIKYIPKSSLSPVMLKKVRVMHILSGNEKREIADDYIW